MEEQETHKDSEPTSSWGTSADPRLSPALEAVRSLALAGMGAVAIATEMTDEFFSELVKRGEQTREEAVKEFREVKAKTEERRTKEATYFRARMDSVLSRLNLPSKGDLDSINAKLNILTRKVDEAGSSHGGAHQAGPTSTSEPGAS